MLATSFLAGLFDVVVAIGGYLVAPAVTVAVIVVLHEAAHAIVGRLVGFRILSIELGKGPVWCAFWLGSALVTWSRWPDHGLVRVVASSGCLFRTRSILFFLAGPLANVAFAVGIWSLAGTLRETTDPKMAFLVPTVVIAWAMAVVGFLPVRMSRQPEYVADVVQVWRTLRTNAAAITAWLEAARRFAEHHDFWRAFLRGRVEEASQLAEAGIAAHPEDWAWPANGTLVAFVRGDTDRLVALQASFEAGAAAAVERMDRQSKGKPSRNEAALRRQIVTWPRVNRAFFLVHEGTPAALAEALRLTEGPATHGPTRSAEHVARSRTRGLVLLHMGKVGEGIRELRAAIASSEPYWLRALGAAYLAYGYALQGDERAARRYVRMSKRLHRESPLLPARLRLVDEALQRAQRATGRAPSPAIR